MIETPEEFDDSDQEGDDGGDNTAGPSTQREAALPEEPVADSPVRQTIPFCGGFGAVGMLLFPLPCVLSVRRVRRVRNTVQNA